MYNTLYSICFDTPWYKDGNCIMRQGGIYIIRNTFNNKIYIGSSKCLHRRYQRHRKPLLLSIHYNLALQHSFSKHGTANFIFEIIELVEDNNNLLVREQYWLDKLQPFNNNTGYNITEIAGPTMNIGKSPSKETREKISKTLISHNYISPRKGVTLSDDIKRKISNSVLKLQLFGSKLPQSKSVIIRNIINGDMEEFESITALSNKHSISRTTIAKYCKEGGVYKNNLIITLKDGE